MLKQQFPVESTVTLGTAYLQSTVEKTVIYW